MCELEDILDKLVFEDEPSIFLCDNYADDFIETVLHMMDDFMTENPHIIAEPDFTEIILEEVKNLCYVQLEEYILNSDYVEDDMNDLIESAFEIYNIMLNVGRSEVVKQSEVAKQSEVIEQTEVDDIERKIQKLKEQPQPVQRTPEWYEFRWNLITASNAWKAFEGQCTVNQLIYEKCQPLNTEENEEVDETVKVINKMVNTTTTLHWGQKYEPLSVMFYEDIYDSKVDDFGCIQHPVYKFIGASPDGIVVQSNTNRYGRMLEIKNIVNREITGIPKKEYWIQMQLQMEVCDLNECDFLETKFTEYTDYEQYKNDHSHKKGIIIHFHKKDGSPHYEYMPLKETNQLEWETAMISKYENAPYNYSFLKFIYWKLDKLSCVLVLRNKDWFKTSVLKLEKVWDIIEKERISGYEHRAPTKKAKKEMPTRPYANAGNNNVCFLQVIKVEPTVDVGSTVME